MINTTLLNWKKNKLYHADKDTGFSVSDYGGMCDPLSPKSQYLVKWPDGVLSGDHYNLSWARYHARREYMKSMGEDEENIVEE